MPAQDEHYRAACETLVTTDLVLSAGEFNSQATIDYAAIDRQVIRDVGHISLDAGGCPAARA